jgi:hypothetical protein
MQRRSAHGRGTGCNPQRSQSRDAAKYWPADGWSTEVDSQDAGSAFWFHISKFILPAEKGVA